MKETLQLETERLVRSWAQHEAAWLRDYLVTGVEDPRLNLQSILSRHFLVRALVDDQFDLLMQHEYRFAAVMDWLLRVTQPAADPDELATILYALRKGADNAEGLEIPRFVLHAFATLPAPAMGIVVPNYLEGFLTRTQPPQDRSNSCDPLLDTFCAIWNRALETEFPIVAHGPAVTPAGGSPAPECVNQAGSKHRGGDGSSPSNEPQDVIAGDKPSLPRFGEIPGSIAQALPPRLSLLEPACGSANDYRFLHSYGLARLFDYTGFDLCQKNIENARGLFPAARFDQGNVFEICAETKAFDFCVVHDLFEHLSLAGLEQAAREVCRVTRRGMCIAFFQMDEIPDHIVRPVEEYHWNLLSLPRMKDLFAGYGFSARAVHIGTFLQRQFGRHQTHNPNAYTFFLHSV